MAQKETKTFNPIDESGAIARRCESAEDLEGFVVWLCRQDQESKEARERAYRKLSGNQGGDLRDEKGQLVAEVSGEFFGKWLKEANVLARIEQADGGPKDGAGRASLGKARRVLGGLLRALKTELFGEALRGAEMAPEAVAELEKDLASDGKMLAQMGRILAEKTDKEMKAASRKFMKTAQCRAFVKGSGRGGRQEEVTDLGYYAPLIEYLARDLGPAQRAELLGRFSAYVDSGWAAEDMLSGSGSGAALREAVDAVVRDPAGAEGLDVSKILDDRMNQVMLSLKLGGPKAAEVPDVRERWDAARMERVDAKLLGDESRLAKSGYMDAALVSPDGMTVVAYASTSDPTLGTQKDEWARHFGALMNSAKDEKFLASIGAAPGAETKIVALMPALLGSGKTGKRVRDLFEGELGPEEEEAVLTVMFAHRFLTGNVFKNKYEMLSKVEPVVVGASMDSWVERMAAADLKDSIDAKEAAVKEALCSAASTLLACAERKGLKPMQLVNASNLGETGEAFVRAFVGVLQTVAEAPANGSKVFLAEKKKLMGKDKGWERWIGALRSDYDQDTNNLSKLLAGARAECDKELKAAKRAKRAPK